MSDKADKSRREYGRTTPPRVPASPGGVEKGRTTPAKVPTPTPAPKDGKG
jgi:hypothetical protein